jgi:TonB family protein
VQQLVGPPQGNNDPRFPCGGSFSHGRFDSEFPMRTSSLLLLAAGSALLTSSPATFAACDPTVLESPTRFPLQSQVRGQEGEVFLDVTVDESGHVTETQLLRSSGYELLDRAASASIRDQWKFDVSSCERKDLPIKDLISVVYRHAESAE